MERTRQLDIIKHLKDSGFDAYLPGKHKGECISSYVVVKTGETVQYNNYSSTVTYYDILCYVPEDVPSQIDSYLDSVVTAMKALYPMIQPTHTHTAPFYDTDVKGHMRSAQYINYRKL